MRSERATTVLGFASSVTTLVCWAFPILLVTLGLGSVVASAVTTAPWLAVVSRHKNLVFAVSASLLAFNYWLVIVRPRRCAPGEICHVDSPSMRWNRRMFWFSAVVYVLAAVLTFGSLLVLSWFWGDDMRNLIACVAVSLLPATALASGHGPLFGGATPTLGKGGWQLDQAWMGRMGERHDADEQMLRTMISFGITEDLQISASMPIPLQSSVFMPMGRMMSLMSGEREFESIVSWRFHRRPTNAGGRFESTLMGGFTVPLEKYSPDGMQTAPSMTLGAATGYASRAHYMWLSGGYQRRTAKGGSRMGDVTYVSAVYGYRPPALRLDYPKPDLRFFVEAVAEHTGMARHFGFDMLYTGGKAVFAGPTALLLYKAYALQGGVLLPVYQRTNGLPNERFRFGVNVSYFFWFK